MKKLKLLTIGIVFLSSLTALAEIHPEEGNERGNGGDEYAEEFVQVGYNVLESLSKDPLPLVNNDLLLAAIRRTRVNSRPTLQLRGNEVDAINFPSQESPHILLNRSGWDRMKEKAHRRAFLVLHEYLGIMGVEDGNYQISQMLDRAKVCDRDFYIRKGLEDSSRKYCYRITSEDLHFMPKVMNFGSDDGEPTKGDRLGKRDLAGLDSLTIFRYSSQPSHVAGDLFENSSFLDSASIFAPKRIDQFMSHNSIKTLNMLGDKTGTRRTESIADAAFANLSGLDTLYLQVDARTVDIGRALMGATNLKRLDVIFEETRQAPNAIADVAKQNPDLSWLVIIVPGGQVGSVQSDLTSLGYTCGPWDNYYPNAETALCTRRAK